MQHTSARKHTAVCIAEASASSLRRSLHAQLNPALRHSEGPELASPAADADAWQAAASLIDASLAVSPARARAHDTSARRPDDWASRLLLNAHHRHRRPGAVVVRLPPRFADLQPRGRFVRLVHRAMVPLPAHPRAAPEVAPWQRAPAKRAQRAQAAVRGAAAAQRAVRARVRVLGGLQAHALPGRCALLPVMRLGGPARTAALLPRSRHTCTSPDSGGLGAGGCEAMQTCPERLSCHATP